MSIKDLVKNNTAKFQYYRGGSLWYKVDDFLFPVPVSDIGEATFMDEDKAILFMRYIRKYMKEMDGE